MRCQEVSGVVHSARLCTTSQHSSSGTWLTITFRLLHVSHPLTQKNVNLQNSYFNEFVAGSLMPPIHLSYPTATADICKPFLTYHSQHTQSVHTYATPTDVLKGRFSQAILHQLFSPFVWPTVAFDRWPTHRYIRVLRRVFQVKELQVCHRVTALPRKDQDRERIPVLPRLFVCTSPLAVTTVVGFLVFRRVSSAAKLKTFLLSICIAAPESTTDSRSSGFFEEGAGMALASVGE